MSMRESPYTGRGGFQLKIFYIPEKQCAYIQRKTKIRKNPYGRLPSISTTAETMRLARPA